ncbi:hypothetical protein MA16_Dca024770 [Dendrobium catenatum]|uniref:THH1/TOM1/TOM3 domain-containing protein n=1 Tax=Dendrobium catenatum TaxID=906689 RepID=A0A2I0XAI2_9ASPA|nr:hypothetical protein MA16_Dca024770 [Dendrobium catenatum]
MFYSAGLPFNLARNPHYKNAFTYACNNNLAGYVPPGYNVIKTKLLQRERDNIEKLLEPTRGVWKEKGVTLVFTSALLDLPGLLFFSTYTLLVLFWAEIYHQESLKLLFFFFAQYIDRYAELFYFQPF